MEGAQSSEIQGMPSVVRQRSKSKILKIQERNDAFKTRLIRLERLELKASPYMLTPNDYFMRQWDQVSLAS